jgi:benzodiazapine receptor
MGATLPEFAVRRAGRGSDTSRAPWNGCCFVVVDMEPDASMVRANGTGSEPRAGRPVASLALPRTRPVDWGALALFTGLTAGAALAGGLATRKNLGFWYMRQRKPSFQPPSSAFGPVWTGLYAMIAASGYLAYRAPRSAARSRALTLWGVQMGLNTAWTVLFFGARRKKAAFADIVLLLGSITAYVEASRRVDRKAAWLFVPYLGWVTFAAALNEELIRLNEGWPGRA